MCIRDRSYLNNFVEQLLLKNAKANIFVAFGYWHLTYIVPLFKNRDYIFFLEFPICKVIMYMNASYEHSHFFMNYQQQRNNESSSEYPGFSTK